MTREDAASISSVLAMPGWEVIVRLLEEQRNESQQTVLDLMDSQPDKLTGKVAIRHAARAKSLLDFKEAVYDSQKILTPPTARRGA